LDFCFCLEKIKRSHGTFQELTPHSPLKQKLKLSFLYNKTN